MASNRWTDRTNPHSMLPALRRWISPRRAVLLGVAVSRRIEPLLTENKMRQLQELGQTGLDPYLEDVDPRSCQQLIAAVEESADHQVDKKTIDKLRSAARRFAKITDYYFACYSDDWGAVDFSLLSLSQAAEAVSFLPDCHDDSMTLLIDNAAIAVHLSNLQNSNELPEDDDPQLEFEQCDPTELAQQCDAIRDLCPLERKLSAIPIELQKERVVQLAREIYDNHVFENMPVLADALIDAGCDDATIIEHCRSSNPHYRGCWVIDGILGLH